MYSNLGDIGSSVTNTNGHGWKEGHRMRKTDHSFLACRVSNFVTI